MFLQNSLNFISAEGYRRWVIMYTYVIVNNKSFMMDPFMNRFNMCHFMVNWSQLGTFVTEVLRSFMEKCLRVRRYIRG